MSPQDIEKLLGGYATDTLTEAERRTLFEAALGNQALFDALADEQALRELLQDPPSRAHLLEALREERPSLGRRLASWFRQPAVLALTAAAAAGIVTISIVIPRYKVAEKPAAVALNITPPQQQPAATETTKRGLERRAAMPAPAGSPATPVAHSAPAQTKSRAPAEPAPAGSPRTFARDTERRDQLLETDALMKRREAPKPAEPPALAAPPAPPPAVVTSAQTQFKSADENKVQVQAQAPQVADAAAPRQVAGAGGGAQLQDRKKETAAAGARALYYSSQPAAVGGFVAQPRNAPSKAGAPGRALTLRSNTVPAPAPAIGGVRYTIQRRNLDGSFVDVEPAATLMPGDAIRVRFETNLAGNLSVMERQPNGGWTVRLAAQTQAGAAVYMPADGTINVTGPGAVNFFVRFSRSLRTEAKLDEAAATAGLARETAANSVYVVNPVAAADPVVDFEIAIKVR